MTGKPGRRHGAIRTDLTPGTSVWRLGMRSSAGEPEGRQLVSLPRLDDHTTDALSAVLARLVATLSVAALTYLAVVGFAGGGVPLLGWELPGGALPGLLWLAVLGSAGVVALWFLPLLATASLVAAVTRIRPTRRGPAAGRAAGPLKHA